MFADQFRRGGPSLRNLADAIESGQHDHSFWGGPAMAAIDQALRFGPPDVDPAP